jgi:hypothetical protein
LKKTVNFLTPILLLRCNKEKKMRNLKQVIPFGISLICMMLFTACIGPFNPSPSDIQMSDNTQWPTEAGYGRISIIVEDEDSLQATRTTFPSIDFERYVYTFIKEGEAPIEIAPDNQGYFNLVVGNYTVEVKAYISDNILAAIGESSLFSVGPGSNVPIKVLLSDVTGVQQGTFNYIITYPTGATAEISLQMWPELSNIPLAPETQGNRKTQTLQLEPGSYLLTILVNKEGLYAGITEAIQISSSLTTNYEKTFNDGDMLAVMFPATNDYNISGIGTFIHDGTAKTASITRKENASTGAITILYNGTETPPVNVGTYTVTFNVAAVPGWSAATGLPAGTIIIDNPTPAASDYNVSGTGTFTYAPDTTRTVSITPREGASPGAITAILYNGSATAPVNAGTYAVTFNVAAATGWNAANGIPAGNIIINRAAGGAVAAPVLNSRTQNSITINAVTAPSTGQTVEYAISTSTTAPTTGYQTGTTFTGLSASRTYYI